MIVELKGPFLAGAAFFFSKARQPVERALHDEGGGVLVDQRGPLLAAHVGGNQFALDRGIRKAGTARVQGLTNP